MDVVDGVLATLIVVLILGIVVGGCQGRIDERNEDRCKSRLGVAAPTKEIMRSWEITPCEYERVIRLQGAPK